MVLLAPVTIAENCCVCDWDRLADAGLTETAIGGFTVMEALADLVGSAVLVAITRIVLAAAIVAGA